LLQAEPNFGQVKRHAAAAAAAASTRRGAYAGGLPERRERHSARRPWSRVGSRDRPTAPHGINQ